MIKTIWAAHFLFANLRYVVFLSVSIYQFSGWRKKKVIPAQQHHEGRCLAWNKATRSTQRWTHQQKLSQKRNESPQFKSFCTQCLTNVFLMDKWIGGENIYKYKINKSYLRFFGYLYKSLYIFLQCLDTTKRLLLGAFWRCDKTAKASLLIIAFWREVFVGQVISQFAFKETLLNTIFF